MPRSRTALSLAALFLCTAAASTHEVVVEPQAKLARTGSIFVATPHDATYGTRRYPGSGATAATAVVSAFARVVDSTEASAGCADLACLTRDSKRYEYYVVPQILHWEDRATEWSGKRDKLEIKVTVYSPEGAVLASSIFSAKSKLFTFGGDHPQDLLQKPLDEFARSLF